jgi:fructokinase
MDRPGAATAVGIGELLWDLLPAGKRLGGAPLNFACHSAQLGAKAYPVSCLGSDAPGWEIRRELASLGLDDSYVAEDAGHPTGSVQVTLDEGGKPSYTICADVAWDFLAMSDRLVDLAAKTDAVCFGSLAQRGAVSCSTIQAFLGQVRPEALRIFDINLRQAFYGQEIVAASLESANVLKLSDEELPVLAGMFGLAGTAERQMAALMGRFDLRLIAYTRGAGGSLLMTPDEMDAHPGFPAAVVDTVGAGDAFTAALCAGLLQRCPLTEINHFANRVAAFVCAQQGATPVLPPEVTNQRTHAQ